MNPNGASDTMELVRKDPTGRTVLRNSLYIIYISSGTVKNKSSRVNVVIRKKKKKKTR